MRKRRAGASGKPVRHFRTRTLNSSNQDALSARSSSRSSRRILAVIFLYEGARDVYAVGGIEHGHLAAINDDSDTALFGVGFERFADVFLKRAEDFRAAFVVGTRRILVLALIIF